MEEQSSILLQKKIIFIMTILILFASFICAKKDSYILASDNVAVIAQGSIEPECNTTTIAQNLLNSSRDIIVSKNIQYTALTEIAEDLVNPTIQIKSEPELIINDTHVEETIVNDLQEATNSQENQVPESVNFTVTETFENQVANTSVPTEYENVLSMSATAYCLCQKCCGKPATHPEFGVTASGYKITPGSNDKVIAVDTSVIPLGTKVYVEGLNGANSYGYAVAADTGSAIKNMKIDLYMDSHADALNWGFRKVNVYLLEE